MKSIKVPSWVMLVFVCAHLLALGWAFTKRTWNFPDSDRYFQAAENIRLHNEVYARPWLGKPVGQAVQEFTIRSAGYPVVLRLTAASSERILLLLVVQNCFSLLIIWLILSGWACWARPAKNDWYWAVGGILTFPAQFIYANAVMSEILLQAAVVSIVGSTLCFIKAKKKPFFVGAVGALVLALLLKPVFYPLAAVTMGLGMIMAWRYRQLALAFIASIPLVVVFAYMGWNWQRTGYFHFSSIAEINLLHYNAAGVVRQLEGASAEAQWVASVLQDADNQASFAARQHVINVRAGAMILAHPFVYAQQHLQGMAAFYLDPGRFDIAQFMNLRNTAEQGFLAQARAGTLPAAVMRLPLTLLGLLGAVLIANVMRLLLAIRGFILLGKSSSVLRRGRWVALGIILYVSLMTGPLGAARFLVPVWPLLMLFALFGLKQGVLYPTKNFPLSPALPKPN